LIALAVVIALIAIGVVLVYHFRDELRRHDSPATSENTVTATGVEKPRRTPDPPPGDDLIESGEPLWTALDDHQLNRLLRESSS
jgi:hypothetical protein